MWKQIVDFLTNHRRNHYRLQGKTVLVVDDSEIDRRTAQRVLEKNGCRVLAAMDGEEGIRIAQNEPLDLILLDCMMPGLTGPDVCKRLKEKEHTKNIPIIFLTGSDTPANIINCFDLGAEQFLAKPVSARTLVAQIETILDELKSL